MRRPSLASVLLPARVPVRFGALLALALPLAASCSDDEHGTPDAAPINCETDTRGDNLVAGLEKVGDRGVVTFRLMSASPSPPKRPTNNWVVHVEAGGQPVTGVELHAKPYMPEHMHGTGIKPVISEIAGTPGDYKVDQLDLWMAGIWEITFDITPPGGVKDQVVFRACLPP